MAKDPLSDTFKEPLPQLAERLERKLQAVEAMEQSCRAYVQGGDEGLSNFLDQHFANLRKTGQIRNEGHSATQD